MNDCIFCRIAAREIPATILFESETVLAFRDVHPQAPTHVLIVPKRHVPTLLDVGDDEAMLLGELQRVAVAIARQEGLESGGFRLVTNCGAGAGQSVFHLHLHLLGGRRLSWPPG